MDVHGPTLCETIKRLLEVKVKDTDSLLKTELKYLIVVCGNISSCIESIILR